MEVFVRFMSSSGYQGNNQLTGWGYDASGNVEQVGSMNRSFTYDAENRQVTANINGVVTSYEYDGEGRRVRKTVGAGAATTYVYDAMGVLAAEYGSAATSGLAYLSVDALGSTRLETDEAGAVSKCYDYEPFGGYLYAGTNGRSSCFPAAPVGDGVRFTGKERDAETGLDFFLARYYSSAQGRFTSPDEWAGGIVDPFSGGQIGQPRPLPYADITDPQTINKYAYVRNNPMRYTDPDGHIIDTLADIGFIAYDIYDIAKNGASTTSVLALGADVVGAVVPFATGLGAGVRAAHAVEAGVHGAEALTRGAEAGSKALHAGEETVRVRHYTNTKGIEGIKADGVIRAKDQGKVFVESAANKAKGGREAEAIYGLKRGRGKNYVETNVPASRVKQQYNKRMKINETVIEGDVPLNDPTFHNR